MESDMFLKYTAEISILYVEDDVFLAKSNSRILSKFFSKIDLAHDGQQGLELYRKRKYDIVICDIIMPKMDGIELTKEIKNIDSDQYVVITSTDASTGSLLQLINLGVNSFLVKPIDQSKIIASLYFICKSLYESKELKKLRQKEIFDSFVVAINHNVNQYLASIYAYIDFSKKLNHEKYQDDDLERYLDRLKKCSMGIAMILKKIEKLKEIKFIDYIKDVKMLDIDL